MQQLNVPRLSQIFLITRFPILGLNQLKDPLAAGYVAFTVTVGKTEDLLLLFDFRLLPLGVATADHPL